MSNKITESAGTIALELVKRDTDLNEVAKIAAYQRTHGSGEQFFRLLDLMVRDGRYLVRSGRTLDYYRDIHDVCQQHLKAYRQAKDQQARELAQILGWAVRLMRYYKSVGVPASEPQRNRASELPLTPTDGQSRTNVRTEKREWVTLIEAAKRGKASVETEDGMRVICGGFSAYPLPRKSMRCQALVTREDNVPQNAIFKGWK